MKTGSIDSEEAKRIVRDAIARGWARMPTKHHEIQIETKKEASQEQTSESKNDGNVGAETIHGLRVTRERALEGLGDPATWETQSEEAKQEFKAKPEVPESVQRITAYHGNCRWCGSTRVPVDGHCLRCGRPR